RARRRAEAFHMIGDRRHDTRELAEQAASLRSKHVGGHRGDVAPQPFGEWLVGNTDVFIASTEKHCRADGMLRGSKLGGQSCLADARLAADEHGRASVERVPPATQLCDRFVASNEDSARGKRLR